MKITIDVRMFLSSGIGSYLKNLLPLIIENLSNISFSLLGQESVLSKAGILDYSNVDHIPFNVPIYSIKEQLVITRLIPKNTDLFWSPHYNIPLMYKGKLFVTVHDLNHLALTQPGFDWAKKKYAKYLFKKILQKADRIITVSNFSRSEYIKYFGLEKDFEKIVAVHNGLLINEVIGDNNPHKKPYVLTVGNVKPHKNLVRLLNAFNKIKDLIPHTLFIVGKKSGFISGDENLIKKVDAFGERVIMTGFLSDEELQNYYSHAEAFVFPSLYEGFGFPPLEAMAVGTPVVASNAASIPEVCGDAALYFDPYDINDMARKILQIIQDKSLKNEYIYRGKLQVARYSWEDTAKQIIYIIKKIIGS